LVKGKKTPVKVFTVIGDKNKLLTKKQKVFNLKYANGLSFYKKNDFKNAILFFKEADLLIPNEGSVQVLLKKCYNNISVSSI